MTTLGKKRFYSIFTSVPSPWREELEAFIRQGWEFEFFLTPFDGVMMMALMGKRGGKTCISIASETADLFSIFVLNLRDLNAEFSSS
ncbi:MAG: hypothetical protein D6820_17115 [Lentisphaerae bacterium]|nr:MAG: hypothetical protein D6820_17115 [Lentisphaerota bacterium]